MIRWSHFRQSPNDIGLGSTVFAQHIRVTNTDGQTTLRATSTACMRCVIKICLSSLEMGVVGWPSDTAYCEGGTYRFGRICGRHCDA